MDDIIKLLWRDLIDREGEALREEINALYDFTVTPENARYYYRVGDDNGLIQIKRGPDCEYLTVGEITTDYSEPCLKYQIYDTV